VLLLILTDSSVPDSPKLAARDRGDCRISIGTPNYTEFATESPDSAISFAST
jgi:hypothetical protein